MRRWAGSFGLLLLIGMSACQTPPSNTCKIATIGNLPILNSHGSPIVRATVNDHPVAFTVDTGAFNSTIDEYYADRLGVTYMPGWLTVSGFGGDTFANGGRVDKLGLGSATAHDLTFLLAGHSRRTIDGLPVIGWFGSEFLTASDVVVDMPDHVMQMLDMRQCGFPTPTWSGKTYRVSIRHDDPSSTKVGVTFSVNGKSVDGFVDTGASSTMISLAEARRAGVTMDMLQRDPQRRGFGIANRPFTIYRHRFDQLAVGDLVVSHPVLSVLDEDGQDLTVLGADFLIGHRIWITRGSAMYIQRAADIPADDPARSGRH